MFALLALMYLHFARFDSRTDPSGMLIPFEQQDRARWGCVVDRQGLMAPDGICRGDVLTDYHLEASVAAQHCTASSFEETNWVAIEQLYEQLLFLKPSPLVRLNLAIVRGHIAGPVPRCPCCPHLPTNPNCIVIRSTMRPWRVSPTIGFTRRCP